MHRVPVSLPLLLAALFVHAEHPLIYTSPARFADEVADVCSARGGESGSPEPEVRSRPLVVDRSTLIRTLAGFPQDFLDGLVAEERYGYISFPISVRIDPASGCALFEEATS